jgi:monoterpene epsilon-lactone hydrolase
MTSKLLETTRMLVQHKRRHLLALAPLAALLPFAARGDDAKPPAFAGSRQLPARNLPVPDTVSYALQSRIAAPYPTGWDVIPRTPAEWKQMAARSSAEVLPNLPALRERLGVRVESAKIAGVPVFVVTPNELPASNRERLLVHVHGGGYVLYPGEAGAGEAMLRAGYGRFKVISVDYRMPPDHPFPAALDDAMAVWRAVVDDNDPRKMAIFGSSAGGGLTLAMVLKARSLGLPLPAAIAPGTPWSDLSGNGDSIFANAYVDNVLVANTGWVGAAALLYAAGHDLRDPLISPIYGDFHGFPPAIVTSGTRDLFLSNAVRTHRKLRQAGVDAALQVFEGQSHAQFLDASAPECAEAFGEISRFLGTRLAA